MGRSIFVVCATTVREVGLSKDITPRTLITLADNPQEARGQFLEWVQREAPDFHIRGPVGADAVPADMIAAVTGKDTPRDE
jgi:hypothetical protein